MKLWAGRFSKEADKKTNDFNSSIATDSRMYAQDIEGSIAHVTMLAAKGIIPAEDGAAIAAELVRGKSGRVFGDLMTLLTVMKGLPLAYNKDMQEDKDAIFDAFDTVNICLVTLVPMISTMKALPENMRKAAAGGFINATDCADYLVSKGLPFRDAYKATGELVALCIKTGKTLETLSLDEYKSVCDLFDDGVYDAIKLENCVKRRGLMK